MTALAVSLALVGCSSTAAPQEEPTPEPTTPTPVATATPEPDRWPLTGLATTELTERPALAIKVENSTMARPQTGLAEADVVWEEMVEGGITRFNAVYHSQLPQTVGPIRSVRPMDAAIVAPLGGPQVISGGQRLFLEELGAAGIQLISHDAGARGFTRSPDRRAPHNLYGTPEIFLEQAASTAPPPAQFHFAPELAEATAVRQGSPVSGLDLAFPSSAPGWTWDGAAEVWLREEGTTAALGADGEQLTAANVVVLRVEIVASAGRDQSGNPVPETVLTGGGDAVVVTGGRLVEATWTKETVTDPVELVTVEGAPVLLTPGTTWVELVPRERGTVTPRDA